MAHAGGRPTEYKSKYVAKADEYLKKTIDKGKKVSLPTTDGFALFIGVARSSLYEWEKKNPEFSDALNKIRIEQQERLLNKGLSGHYNSTIAKLILSANHGMREKSDVTSDDKPVQGNTIVFGNFKDETDSQRNI